MGRLAVVALLLLAACARPPVSDDVTIDVEKNDRVRITVATTFDDSNVKTPSGLADLDTARSAAMNGLDDWAARFARVTPEDEARSWEKHRGKVERVTRSIRIPQNDLQQVFSDTNITVSFLNAEGWRELSFYPGGSSRATHEQRKHFDDALTSWSGAASRYYNALHDLYVYLDANPQRASALFEELLNENDGMAGASIADEERPLVDATRVAMDEIATRMDVEQDDATTFAEEADLIFNPFPARISVRVPGDVIARDGFSKDLIIERVNLVDAISAEGRWASPDPLASLLRDEQVSSSMLARQPRTSKPVRAQEIAEAVRQRLQTAKSYSVRWRP